MTDFATAGYIAALLDTGYTINLSEKKPVIQIFTDDGQDEMILDEIGCGHRDKDWGVKFVGWPEVQTLLEEIGDFVKTTGRQVDTIQNLELYITANGNNAEARRAADTQVRAQGQGNRSEPLTFDLETMGFESDKMNMLSSSFQWGDREDDKFDVWKKSGTDAAVAVECRDILECAPFSIGWNSSRFDIPYLNTRLRQNGERPAFVGSHDDASVIYDRKHNRKKRTSLVDAANECGVTDEKVHKTPIDWEKWKAANAGNMGPGGMEYVLEHGDMDVILTRRVYNVTVE